MAIIPSIRSAKKNLPLTPYRIFRGLLCLSVYLSTAFMILSYFAPVALLIRLFSVHHSRSFVSFIFGHWLSLWPFLFEKINKTKVIFSGERIPIEKRVLIIANHKTEIDWMYLWNLALRKGCLGYVKYVLKGSLMKLPIFGWGFHILEFIPVMRNWESDRSVMYQMLTSFFDPHDPLWLVVFPEGTDYTEQKCLKSQIFAQENGLPVLKNVLLPKSRGFNCCLETLRGSLDAVYDITIGYKHKCPSFMDNVFGVDPSEVHLHIRRILITEIPSSETETASWLMNEFVLKDHLLDDFIASGCFPEQRTEKELPTSECVTSICLVLGFTGIFIYLTFYASIWFRVYVALSCAYLACSTYFNLRVSPLVDLQDIVPHKKTM